MGSICSSRFLLVCTHSRKPWFVEYIEGIVHANPNRVRAVYVERYDDDLGDYHADTVVFLQSAPPLFIVQTLREQGRAVFVLNTEQASQLEMGGPHAPSLRALGAAAHANLVDGLWDYSRRNASAFERAFPGLKVDRVVPMLPDPPCLLASSVPDKDLDVGFVGAMSPRRSRVIQELRDAGINVTVVTAFGDARDAVLFRCKVLLNVHYAESYRIFEEIRCSRLVFNGTVVVSELSELDDDHPVKPFVVFAEVDALAAAVRNILANYGDGERPDTRLREALMAYGGNLH